MPFAQCSKESISVAACTHCGTVRAVRDLPCCRYHTHMHVRLEMESAQVASREVPFVCPHFPSDVRIYSRQDFLFLFFRDFPYDVLLLSIYSKIYYERMIKYGAPHYINRHFSVVDMEPTDAVEV
jgi:hypothetical protein